MLALCLIAFRILLRERGLSYWMSNGKETSLALKFVFVVVQLRSSMSSCGCFQCVCVWRMFVCVLMCVVGCAQDGSGKALTLDSSTSSIINPNEPRSSCDSFLSLTRISCKQETSSLMLVDRWRRRMRMRMRSKAVASANSNGNGNGNDRGNGAQQQNKLQPTISALYSSSSCSPSSSSSFGSGSGAGAHSESSCCCCCCCCLAIT